jgi:guanine nucleotide-binding protein subunit alpha
MVVSISSFTIYATLIHRLWQDLVMPKVMDHSSEFYLMDSASWSVFCYISVRARHTQLNDCMVVFFNEALSIGEQGYVPTEKDVLRAR